MPPSWGEAPDPFDLKNNYNHLLRPAENTYKKDIYTDLEGDVIVNHTATDTAFSRLVKSKKWGAGAQPLRGGEAHTPPIPYESEKRCNAIINHLTENRSIAHDMNAIVGTHDIILMTFDTLRYDVAQSLWQNGRTPHLAALLPDTGWEKRHSPASFTYAAHQAFFAGFLPTPTAPGYHFRPFALQFEGSTTIALETCVLSGASLPEGLADRGYRTICIGGVGFFNQRNPLGNVLPGLFQERYWSPELGVTDRHSTENQVRLACDRLNALPKSQRVFLFLNLSALHQPNYFYLPGATTDSLETHAAALEYIDRALLPLWQTLRDRAPAFGILCSDHGTTYGEDGYTGHRIAHPIVWTVPYAEILLHPSP